MSLELLIWAMRLKILKPQVMIISPTVLDQFHISLGIVTWRTLDHYAAPWRKFRSNR